MGEYDEKRFVYREATDLFKSDSPELERDVHLGVDLFLPAGSPVHAPMAGRVHSFQDNAGFLDYGPTVILEHTLASGAGRAVVYTLYGHLSRDTLAGLAVGGEVAGGQTIGRVGSCEENGGWPPHVHFQVVTDMREARGNYHGVCSEATRDLYLGGLVLSPWLVLGRA